MGENRKKKASRKAPAAAKAGATRPRPSKKAAARPGPTVRTATAKPSRNLSPKKAAKAPAKRRVKGPPSRAAEVAADPEGYFVARVRGEDAVREAPHPMLDVAGFEEASPAPSAFEEDLGELPATYREDALMVMPRDPHTLYVYWDYAPATRDAAFAGLSGAKAQLWLFAKGAGWERVQAVDFAFEAHGWYLHGLEPGRQYRVEIHVVDGHGADRLLPQVSNAVALPPLGPSEVLDDRFVEIPFEAPLPKQVGPGHEGGPFSEELRTLLARLSDWARFQGSSPSSPPGAGGMGGRPTSWPGPRGGANSPVYPYPPRSGEGE
jgi:uncharacterized protein